MTAVAAEAVGCRPEQMLVCSTGVIGRHLPMDRDRAAASARAAAAPGSDAGRLRRRGPRHPHHRHAHQGGHADGGRGRRRSATDRRGQGGGHDRAEHGDDAGLRLHRRRRAGRRPGRAGRPGRRPDASTASASRATPAPTTRCCCSPTAGPAAPPLQGEALGRFGDATAAVCGDLARAIAADAEGATHLIVIDVEGLRDDDEARRVAKTVAESALVKTAMFGADPNWGRIVSAAGYCRRRVRGRTPVAVAGRPAALPRRRPAAVRRRGRLGLPEARADHPHAPALHARRRPMHLLDVRPDATSTSG